MNLKILLHGNFDVVAMDEIYYGEPRAIGQHSSDFDGDGTSNYAVFRPSNSIWFILQSSNNQICAVQFGANGDKIVAADYDKDGRTDIAVWRGGIYYVLQSSNNQFRTFQWGASGDVPIGATQ